MSPSLIFELRKLSSADQKKRIQQLYGLSHRATPDDLEERIWLEVELGVFPCEESDVRTKYRWLRRLVGFGRCAGDPREILCGENSTNQSESTAIKPLN